MLAVAHLRVATRSRRGPKKLRGKVFGRNAYLAVTSKGEVLHGLLYLVDEQTTDAELVAWLDAELEVHDRIRPQLQLVARTVEPSIDGPSPNHPAIAAEHDDVAAELRAMLETVQRVPVAIQEPTVMPDVASRLSSLLERTA